MALRASCTSWLVTALLLPGALGLRNDVSAFVYDVVVYGSSPAGIAASIAASNGGSRRVALIEPLGMIGGMGAAGGLALDDQRLQNGTVLTGLARTFCELNAQAYGLPAGSIVTHPDMYIAERSFWTMLNNASVSVFVGCPLDAAIRTGTKVSQVFVTCNGSTALTFNGTAFIDASYDGEVMVAAGVTFTWGREARSVYNESLAGVFFNESLEAFGSLKVSAVYANGSLLPYVSSDALAPAGSGDDKLMAFQHRACITNNAKPGMRTPFPAPPNYDADDFILLQRMIDAVVASGEYPDGPPLTYFTSVAPYSQAAFNAGRPKFIICCGTAPVLSDGPDLNRGWAVASRAQRAAMIAAHTYYLQGSFYYLANDPRVPPATRADTSLYGLCADEFVQFGNWPPQIYVRESVRLVGDYVMTQNNIATPRSKPNDSVSMAVWMFDKHVVSRVAVQSRASNGTILTLAFNEGVYLHSLDPSVPVGVWCGQAPGCNAIDLWFDVPFNVTVPKRADATNLLVPVAISVSSVAFSAARIETMYMDLGAAVGVAAGMVVDAGGALAVQDVPIASVQATLESVYGQRTRGPWW